GAVGERPATGRRPPPAPQSDSHAPAPCAAETACARYRAAPCAPPARRRARPHRPRTAPATPVLTAPLWTPRGPGAAADALAAHTPGAAAAPAAPRGAVHIAPDQSNTPQIDTAWLAPSLGRLSTCWPAARR